MGRRGGGGPDPSTELRTALRAGGPRHRPRHLSRIRTPLAGHIHQQTPHAGPRTRFLRTHGAPCRAQQGPAGPSHRRTQTAPPGRARGGRRQHQGPRLPVGRSTLPRAARREVRRRAALDNPWPQTHRQPTRLMPRAGKSLTKTPVESAAPRLPQKATTVAHGDRHPGRRGHPPIQRASRRTAGSRAGSGAGVFRRLARGPAGSTVGACR